MSYKDDIQVHADEIAWAEHGKDLYDLTEKERDEVYQKAQEVYVDRLASQADSMMEK